MANKIVLDPTAGGGSIPFEALRIDCDVIVNELNPVASIILHATLEYPAKWGKQLLLDIKNWGDELIGHINNHLSELFPDHQKLSPNEYRELERHLSSCPKHIEAFNSESIMDYLYCRLYDSEAIKDYLYCRQVTCPNCGGAAPLLNTCWLSKVAGKQWGVRILTDGKSRNGKVRFETYRLTGGKGLRGEDPSFATVNRGVGLCVHCRQAIDANEIKSQARGESSAGEWKDRLYCVVAGRFQPKLDKNGKPLRYKSGQKKGEIKTEKVRFFRTPNNRDLTALKEADKRLKKNRERWNAEGLIPTESFPQGNDIRPVTYGMPRWCDMFTPRQLLGHVTLIEELNRLKCQKSIRTHDGRNLFRM